MTSADLFQRASGDRRSVGLERLVELLRQDSARALDIIASSDVMTACDGNLQVAGAEPQIGRDGVTSADGVYGLSDLAVDGLAEKLTIPTAYLQRLHSDPTLHGLFDTNVNGWLERHRGRLLLRILRVDDPLTGSGVHGHVRAALSDRYQRLDHLDMLMAALDGVRQSGIEIKIDGCDLTDKRMYVRIYSPAVSALAPTLLARYRSPFDDRSGSELPVVWGGFELINSETGCGAFTIQPRLMVQVCRNGMVEEAGRIRRTHVGARREDEGVVNWSRETDQAHQALLVSQVRDAVRTYLSPQFVADRVRKIEEVAGARIPQPETTLRTLGREMRWSDQQQQDLLAHFIAGGDLTAGGVMHAVTSLAQVVPSADLAYDLERQAIPAMRRAAALAS